MNSEDIENSLYKPFIPTIVEDSSITSCFDECIAALTQPTSTTNNWGNNAAITFEKRFSEHGSSLLQNIESSRIEFSFDVMIPGGVADSPVNNFKIVNSLLSLGKSVGTGGGAVSTKMGGLIDRVEISINNTILNNNSSNKNFSLAFINRLFMNCKDHDEFERVVDNMCVGQKDYILCQDSKTERIESHLYNSAVNDSLTVDSVIYKTLCDIPGATSNMKIKNGIVLYVANVATIFRINKSISLKWLIELFTDTKFTTSQCLDSLGVKIYLNSPEHLSEGNRFTYNSSRMIICRHMLNSISTRKISDFNEDGRKSKFINKSVLIDIPDSTAFYSATTLGLADSYGSRSIDGIQAPVSVVIFDCYTSMDGIPANVMFQHILAPNSVESCNGSEIDGYTVPFTSNMNMDTKYDIYKSALRENQTPFSKKEFLYIGCPVVIKNPSISQDNTLISIKDGHHVGVNIKNGSIDKIVNLQSVAYTNVVAATVGDAFSIYTKILPENIKRYIICNIDNVYYLSGRVNASNTAPSGLRLISGSQSITSEQYEDAIESGYLSLDSSIVYVVRDS